MTKLDRAIVDWLARYPDTTARAYARDWADWLAFLAGESPLRARRPQAQAWNNHLQAAEAAGATIRRKMSACSSAYTYLVGEELTTRNPFAAVNRDRSGGATRYGLSGELTGQLLTAAAHHSPRAHVVVALLVVTGLRVSEACRARLDDLGQDAGHTTLEVVRKRGHTTRIPIPPNLHRLIRALNDDATTGPLIPGPRGGHPPTHWVRTLLTALGQQIGVPGLHPHHLRHTAATLAIHAGRPLEKVQDLMGHASPETTRNYIKGLSTLEDSASYDLDRLLLT